MKHESDGDTDYTWCAWNDPQRFGEKIRGIGNQRKNRDHSDHNIVEISLNSEESHGDLRRLVSTQTPVKH